MKGRDYVLYFPETNTGLTEGGEMKENEVQVVGIRVRQPLELNPLSIPGF